MVKPRCQRVVGVFRLAGLTRIRNGDCSIECVVTFIGETVLQEAEHWHDLVVEDQNAPGPSRRCNVVDADHFEVHASPVRLTRANARTGNVPKARTFGGRQKNWKTRHAGSWCSPVMCSTIGISLRRESCGPACGHPPVSSIVERIDATSLLLIRQGTRGVFSEKRMASKNRHPCRQCLSHPVYTSPLYRAVSLG